MRIDSQMASVNMAIAVPLWIEEVRHHSARLNRSRLQAIRAQLKEPNFGEAWTVPIPRYSATSFNLVAEGLAILSMLPGGVHFFDLHFETQPPLGGGVA